MMIRKLLFLLFLGAAHNIMISMPPRIEDFTGFPPEYGESYNHLAQRHQKRIIFATLAVITAIILYYKSPELKKRLINLFSAPKKSIKKNETALYSSCGCSCVQRLGYCPCLKKPGPVIADKADVLR